mgnify:CR=1 FL=1
MTQGSVAAAKPRDAGLRRIRATFKARHGAGRVATDAALSLSQIFRPSLAPFDVSERDRDADIPRDGEATADRSITRPPGDAAKRKGR